MSFPDLSIHSLAGITNHSLRDKKIGLDFLTPYSYISKYKGGRGNRKRMNTKNKMGESVNFTDSPIWWALLKQVRTFFEQEQLK
ncbi:MAG: hypothetical protein J0M08_12375 [Bacteroidetes bacterium]|nr:hypothetical protein [Bacteroidota bacterium]